MTKRSVFFSAIALVYVSIPLLVMSQGLVPCSGVEVNSGRSITSCQFCHFAQLLEGISDWLITILSVVAAGMIAYSGMKLVTSGGNTSAKAAAKSMITNVIIGFVILLAAWLAIDLLMRTLVGGDINGGPWESIRCETQVTAYMRENTIYEFEETLLESGYWQRGEDGAVATACSSADSCAVVAQECTNAGGTPTVASDLTGVSCTLQDTFGNVTGGGRGVAQCDPGNVNCSVDFLQSIGLTEAQANVMSCVAVTENSGGAVGCSGTGPCGTFQISRNDWRRYSSSVPGCSAEDFGGNITSAQNNGPCNARVMAVMVQSSRGYQPWTGELNGNAWNPAARRCVQNHAGTGDSTNRGF